MKDGFTPLPDRIRILSNGSELIFGRDETCYVCIKGQVIFFSGSRAPESINLLRISTIDGPGKCFLHPESPEVRLIQNNRSQVKTNGGWYYNLGEQIQMHYGGRIYRLKMLEDAEDFEDAAHR